VAISFSLENSYGTHRSFCVHERLTVLKTFLGGQPAAERLPLTVYHGL
jgi:hypothetical protein